MHRGNDTSGKYQRTQYIRLGNETRHQQVNILRPSGMPYREMNGFFSPYLLRPKGRTTRMPLCHWSTDAPECTGLSEFPYLGQISQEGILKTCLRNCATVWAFTKMACQEKSYCKYRNSQETIDMQIKIWLRR